MSTSTSDSSTRFDIDATFECTIPDEKSGQSELVAGKISAAGTNIVVECSNLDALLGTRMGDINALRGISQLLADRGVTLELRGPQGMVARIGDVKASLAQRVVTRSRNIELGRLSNLVPLLAQRPKGREPSGSKLQLPPATLFPLVPTVSRNVRRKITTTHHTHGSGRPRLIFGLGSTRWKGGLPQIMELTGDVTTIGSAPDADLYVADAAPHHAEIRHTRADEYVLYSFSPVGTGIDASKTNAALAEGGVILRTGALVQIGDWRMSFYREEFADHGRPFGGRSGGEFAVQKPQPPRRVRPGDGPRPRT